MSRHQMLKLRRWERHSTVLIVLGALYALVGVTAIFTTSTKDKDTALSVALHLMSLQAWGAVFVVVGLLAMVSSMWPLNSATWGYTAPAALSALWASFYFFGVMAGAPTSTISGAFTWGALAFLWWAIAGLANPVRPPKLTRHDIRKLMT